MAWVSGTGGTSLSLSFRFHFTSLHFTSLHFTSLHFTSLHFTSLHFTSLHFTSLHFRCRAHPFLYKWRLRPGDLCESLQARVGCEGARKTADSEQRRNTPPTTEKGVVSFLVPRAWISRKSRIKSDIARVLFKIFSISKREGFASAASPLLRRLTATAGACRPFACPKASSPPPLPPPHWSRLARVKINGS